MLSRDSTRWRGSLRQALLSTRVVCSISRSLSSLFVPSVWSYLICFSTTLNPSPVSVELSAHPPLYFWSSISCALDMDMPRRKSGRPLSYDRSLLLRAVADVQERRARGVVASVREAAERYCIPKSTLHRHLKTTPPPSPCVFSSTPKTSIHFLISKSPTQHTTKCDCRCAREVQILRSQLTELHQVIARLRRARAIMKDQEPSRSVSHAMADLRLEGCHSAEFLPQEGLRQTSLKRGMSSLRKNGS